MEAPVEASCVVRLSPNEVLDSMASPVNKAYVFDNTNTVFNEIPIPPTLVDQERSTYVSICKRFGIGK